MLNAMIALPCAFHSVYCRLKKIKYLEKVHKLDFWLSLDLQTATNMQLKII